MTMDERLDKLTERHEALVTYLELNSHEWDRRFTQMSEKLERLTVVVGQTSQSIDTLGRIAESHEHRLDSLEDA